MSIGRRLERLEDASGKGCDVCGWGPHMTFEIDDDPDDKKPVKPEYCPACGNPSVLVIRWPDQGKLEERGGGA